MAGQSWTKSQVKMVMTYNDHKIVSNVLTMLLKCEAFSHVREQLLKEKYKAKIGVDRRYSRLFSEDSDHMCIAKLAGTIVYTSNLF